MDGIIKHVPISAFFRMTTSRTQIVEGLCAARVISECFFKEFGSLLIVLFDEHCATFVIKCSRVITICRHGNVCIPLSLLIVLLLQQMKSQRGASKIESNITDKRHLQ